MKLFYCLVLCTLQAPLTGCGLAGLPFSGTVTDVETGEPIPGAIVVAKWSGDKPGPFDAESICYHVESAVSDENGRFKIPGWWGDRLGIMGNEVFTRAYKPGYEEERSRRRKEDIKMRHYIGNSKYAAVNESGRVKYLKKMVRSTGCHDAGKSRRNLYPLYEAYYREVKELQRGDLDWFRRVAAKAAVAVDGHITVEERDEKISEFLTGNLK